MSAVPLWQLLVVLLAFPTLYHLNANVWMGRLWTQQHQRSSVPFWGMVVALHWVTTAAVVWFTLDAGQSLAQIGLPSTQVVVAIVVGITVVGLAVAYLGKSDASTRAQGATTEVQAQRSRGFDMGAFVPTTTVPERCFWVLASLTAGVCEELIYRGFAITVLVDHGITPWGAALLASISFVLIHGMVGLRYFPAYYATGLGFSALFILTGSLAPGIVLHALVDMAMLVGRPSRKTESQPA